MATFSYSGLADTATRLIARFGQAVTQHVPSASGDAFNPTLTDTDYTVTGAVIEFERSEVDGSVVRETDRRVFLSVAGMSVPVAVGHALTIGGIRHRVQNVKPINPGGTVLCYDVHVRA